MRTSMFWFVALLMIGVGASACEEAAPTTDGTPGSGEAPTADAPPRGTRTPKDNTPSPRPPKGEVEPIVGTGLPPQPVCRPDGTTVEGVTLANEASPAYAACTPRPSCGYPCSTIIATVKNAAGDPIPNATVWSDDPWTVWQPREKCSASTATNADGLFKLQAPGISAYDYGFGYVVLYVRVDAETQYEVWLSDAYTSITRAEDIVLPIP